jgi:hypothetical protein
MPGKYPTDRKLAEEIIAFRDANNLTNTKLVRMFGIPKLTNEFLSRYLNDTLDRIVEDFDILAWDILKTLRERVEAQTRIFPSTVITKIGNALDLLREVGHIGCIVGPAGHGKTSGIHVYQIKTPSAIVITANEAMRDGNKLLSAIFAKINTTTWDRRSSRFNFLVERFHESKRPILIDNFQRLAGSGLKLLFDFHDETKSPIGCIGNEEAIKPILANSQHSRRLGITTTYALEDKEIPALAQNIAAQHSDDQTAEIIADLVAFIARQKDQGALGAVSMTVSLMQKLRTLSPDLRNDPRKAIRAAHARLARTYSLPTD